MSITWHTVLLTDPVSKWRTEVLCGYVFSSLTFFDHLLVTHGH